MTNTIYGHLVQGRPVPHLEKDCPHCGPKDALQLADELERELDSREPFSLSMDTGRAIVQMLRNAHKFQRSIEEAEARVCPEDWGFEEYIRHLLSKLALAAEDSMGDRAR